MDGFSKQAKYFPTQLQQWQFLDKYSRWNKEKGRRETWDESVARSVAYLIELSENKLSNKDYTDILNAMLNMEAFGSMRLFAMAGEAARRCNSVLYNCAYVAIDSIRVFSEILYLSMSGTGVGFSVEFANVNKLPEIHKMNSAVGNWIIDDSQQGWAEAFHIGLSSWFSGNDIEFDYSQIRPIGSILKTKGGRASGPEPLKKLLDYSRETIINARGRKLRPIEVHDIVCMIGDCAVSGGSRRSAMISLFDRNDKEMLHAKDYGWWKTHPQRANANNSVVITDDLTRKDVETIMYTMHDGGGGEPGFYMRKNAGKMAPRRTFVTEPGTNPCQPEFATILTPNGIRTFGEVSIGDVIWSGHEWTKIANKWSTGTKPVYKYTASYGEFIGTENHKVFQNGHRVEVKDANTIDTGTCELDDSTKIVFDYQTVMDGLVIGDGSVHKASNSLVYLLVGQDDYDYFADPVNDYLTKERKGLHENAWEVQTTISHEELPYTYERQIPDRFYRGDRNTVASFLRGLFSANGYCIGNRVGLKQTSLKLIKQAQEMLSFLGISSYVTQNKPSVIKWHNGEFESKASYDLNISSDRYEFLSLVGFIQDYKNQAVSGGVQRKKISSGVVQDVEYLGNYEVFDITVECKSHSYWTGGLKVSNCGEVDLNSAQFCNLSQAIIRVTDTPETLKEKVRIATIIGTIQSAATKFKYLSDRWTKNTQRDRLLGVDITGQMDNPKLITPSLLDELREYVVAVNEEYADKLGIERSAATTVCKPSGNSSILWNCAPGIHSQWSDYYIRRVRINANSPMRYALEFSGFKLVAENGQQYDTAVTLVASFPVKAPDGAITNGSRSALEQCEWWKMNKLYWTEHNPSVTISYKADELDGLVDWIYQNQDIIGGMSFLESDNHYYPLAPYSKIDKGTYEQMVQELPEIDFDLLMMLEKEDQTTVAGEIACSAGQCLI